MSTITAPVYGFYAGNDNRVTSTVPAATDAMKAASKTYEPVIYDGAGHGFMRAGQAPDASDANKKAFDDSFQRITTLLTKLSAAPTSHLEKPAVRKSAVAAKVAVATVSCHDPGAGDNKGAATMDMAAMPEMHP